MAKGTSYLWRGSWCVQLVTRVVINFSLGTMISLPSKVSSVDERMLSARSLPDLPSSNSIKSPSFKLRSSKMMTPEIKLDAICCKPNPSPTPTAPPTIANALKSMPNKLSSSSKAMVITARSKALAASSRVCWSIESCLRMTRWPAVEATRPIHNKKPPKSAAFTTAKTEMRMFPASKAAPSK